MDFLFCWIHVNEVFYHIRSEKGRHIIRPGHKNSTIPWSDAKEWDQVLMSIKRVEQSNPDGFLMLYPLAGKIGRRYELLSEPVQVLCSDTCADCNDNCCARATIWFDFQDLLYLYLGLDQFPGCQIYKNSFREKQPVCCHLSGTGCVLSRLERPFVCTWYFCTAQKQLLADQYPGLGEKITQSLDEIKQLRKRLEELFILVSLAQV